MKINVKLFAILRERAGSSELVLELPQTATVETAIAELSARLPAIASLFDRIAVAVNQQYTDRATQLREGDELALIPPVSGG